VSRNHLLGAACLEIPGVTVAFTGVGSPMTQTIGLGMNGPVPASTLNEIEAFYRSHGSATTIHVCPLADPSLIDLLGARAYRITEFNNVLARTADLPPSEITADVRIADAANATSWATVICEGFFENVQITTEAIEMTSLLFEMPGAIPWIACVDGEPAAGGGMGIHDGVANLFGDGTPRRFRRRGLQTNLIRARVRHAAERGCDLITASTLPGTPSQLNYERLGFRVVYTKLVLTREMD